MYTWLIFFKLAKLSFLVSFFHRMDEQEKSLPWHRGVVGKLGAAAGFIKGAGKGSAAGGAKYGVKIESDVRLPHPPHQSLFL